MASQKLSIGSFGSKLNFLPPVGVPTGFYEILPSKHKNGSIPSHMASQKLSIVSFGSKFKSLPPLGVLTLSYEILPSKHKNG